MSEEFLKPALIITGKTHVVRPWVQLDCFQRVLRDRFLSAEEQFSDGMTQQAFHSLWIPGGVEISQFLSWDKCEVTRIASNVQKLIQSFWVEKKMIIAPCMALAVVMDSLQAFITAEMLMKAKNLKSLVFFPELNVVTTARPLLGKTSAEIFSVFEDISTFVSTSAQKQM